MPEEPFCDHTGCFSMYWLVDGKHVATCCPNGNGCIPPNFANGRITEIHDKVLADATLKLIEVIDQIPADPHGRSPSLIITRKGLRLAWLYHNAPPPANGVEVTDEAEIEKLLGIAD
jgi:hypothetical protein